MSSKLMGLITKKPAGFPAYVPILARTDNKSNPGTQDFKVFLMSNLQNEVPQAATIA